MKLRLVISLMIVVFVVGCTQTGQVAKDDSSLINNTDISNLRIKVNELEISLFNTQSNLTKTRSELQTTKNDLQSTKDELQTTKNELQNTKTGLQNSQNEINQLKSTIQKLQTQADSSTAYELMRKTLSDPNLLSNQITDKIISSDKTLNQFRAQISGLLSATINTKLPSVNWVKNSITPLSGRTYQTSMKTVFPIDLETGIPIIGKITIARIEIIATGSVNVETESVSNIQPTINIIK